MTATSSPTRPALRRPLLDRFVPLSGVAAVAMSVVGTVLFDPAPDPGATITAPASSVARALADNAADARAGAWCVLAGVLALMCFVARLNRDLAAGLSRASWLPQLALLGGAGVAATLLASAGLALAGSNAEGYATDPAVAKTLLVLGWDAAALLAPSLAALLLAGTCAAFAGPALPTWLGWTGVFLLALVVGISALGIAGMATMPGFLWVALVSVVLAVRRPAAQRET